MTRHTRIAVLFLALAPTSVVSFAQQAFDRTRVPAPGNSPTLRVPSWTRATLANGAEFIVSEKHDLPLVSFAITFQGGTYQSESASRRGVASITAT
ncbi:MAG TPA: hypothetical protein VFR18_25100, partial [Terriglobia bacterium]|nr:hypothetical protein [Terriglobia bacterium]